MNNLNWKDGGDKPLNYAKGPCPICGEAIMVPTRDYYYAKDGDKWVQAHAKCVPRKGNDSVAVSEIVDALVRVEQGEREIIDLLKQLVAQGAH